MHTNRTLTNQDDILTKNNSSLSFDELINKIQTTKRPNDTRRIIEALQSRELSSQKISPQQLHNITQIINSLLTSIDESASQLMRDTKENQLKFTKLQDADAALRKFSGDVELIKFMDRK